MEAHCKNSVMKDGGPLRHHSLSVLNTLDTRLKIYVLQSISAQPPCHYRHYHFTPGYRSWGGWEGEWRENGDAKQQRRQQGRKTPGEKTQMSICT